MNKTAEISISDLQALSLFKGLGAEALRQLIDIAELEDVPAQTVIFKPQDQAAWTRFLVAGSLALRAADGSERALVGIGNAGIADEPLGLEQPFIMTAVTLTQCRLLRFPTSRLQELLSVARLPGIDVTVLDAEQEVASDRLFMQLVQELVEERLELRSMPDIALRVREAIASPNTSGAEVARIIQADPVIAVQVIKTAYSSLFAGNRPN